MYGSRGHDAPPRHARLREPGMNTDSSAQLLDQRSIFAYREEAEVPIRPQVQGLDQHNGGLERQQREDIYDVLLGSRGERHGAGAALFAETGPPMRPQYRASVSSMDTQRLTSIDHPALARVGMARRTSDVPSAATAGLAAAFGRPVQLQTSATLDSILGRASSARQGYAMPVQSSTDHVSEESNAANGNAFRWAAPSFQDSSARADDASALRQDQGASGSRAAPAGCPERKRANSIPHDHPHPQTKRRRPPPPWKVRMKSAYLVQPGGSLADAERQTMRERDARRRTAVGLRALAGLASVGARAPPAGGPAVPEPAKRQSACRDSLNKLAKLLHVPNNRAESEMSIWCAQASLARGNKSTRPIPAALIDAPSDTDSDDDQRLPRRSRARPAPVRVHETLHLLQRSFLRCEFVQQNLDDAPDLLVQAPRYREGSRSHGRLLRTRVREAARRLPVRMTLVRAWERLRSSINQELAAMPQDDKASGQ